MLPLPDQGVRRSRGKHNSDLHTLCDWAEAQILFEQEALSQTDVVDILLEENVYNDQDFARAFVEDIWQELRRRSDILGLGTPYEVAPNRAHPNYTWTDNLAYSFCLAVALGVHYTTVRQQTPRELVVQGALFERLTTESMICLGWDTLPTGWSAGDENFTFSSLVEKVAAHINEQPRLESIGDWTSRSPNDAGLDVVCVDPFPDLLGGRPLIFLQCASGRNWESKIHTPELATWSKLVDFSNPPIPGVAIPHALDERKFKVTACRIGGVLIDRFRISYPSTMGMTNWTSGRLGQDLRKWTHSRIRDFR